VYLPRMLSRQPGRSRTGSGFIVAITVLAFALLFCVCRRPRMMLLSLRMMFRRSSKSAPMLQTSIYRASMGRCTVSKAMHRARFC
jgi:hypothetical protein